LMRRTAEFLMLPPNTKVLLMGNEAIARGLIEANVKVVTGYPGTPSSEVIMSLAPLSSKLGIYVEWAINEKVAFDIALGAAFAGIKSFVSMKSPGINVASDTIFSAAYSGVNGGLVFLVADDPGPHTTQTEQDSRWYASAIKIPMIEPSDPQEAKDFTVIGYEISEELSLPIMLRTTTRVNHTVSEVILGEVERRDIKPEFRYEPLRYVRASMKWNLNRHKWLNKQLSKLENINEKYNLTKIEGDGEYCVITSGVSYNYVIEALDKLKARNKVKVIKLGITYPLPAKCILDNVMDCKKILIVEELDPYLELNIRSILHKNRLNIEVLGKDESGIPLEGELSPDIVLKAIGKLLDIKIPVNYINKVGELSLPDRPPTLCPGCPHRGTYLALLRAIKELGYRKEEVPIIGDIGCYALSLYPPLEAIWVEHAMGSSIGIALGLKISNYDKPVVATIGDSTFYHGGIPALIEAFNKNINILVIILDNLSIAMTGHQSTPESMKTESGRNVRPVWIEDIIKGIGIDKIAVIDPYNIPKATEVFKAFLKEKGVKVVIARRECAIQARRKGIIYQPPIIDYDICKGCLVCVKTIGCPALISVDNKPKILDDICYGCNICVYACPFNAIKALEAIKNDR